MIVHKKGYKHERYRIDEIEALIGADRDVATIDYDLSTALLDEDKDMSAQASRPTSIVTRISPRSSVVLDHAGAEEKVRCPDRFSLVPFASSAAAEERTK